MFKRSLDASIAQDIVPVTPSDSTVQVFQAFKVKGTAGNVAVLTKGGGNTPRIIPMTTGEIEAVQITKILATGTTATNIVGYKVYT